MTLLLTISPASNVTLGWVVVLPAVNVTEPRAPRNPLAMAVTVYVPAGAVRLNVPSKLAVTDVTGALFVSYRVTVTGLLAFTCPVSVPFGRDVGVGEGSGVKVDVGVGDSTGVDVSVGVGESTGAMVEVGVGDSSGVEVSIGVETKVGVAVGVIASHIYVPTI